MWTRHEITTAMQVMGVGFDDFLNTTLPESEWEWYDLYLKVLYENASEYGKRVTDELTRMDALAVVLQFKEECGNEMPKLSKGQAYERVLQRAKNLQAMYNLAPETSEADREEWARQLVRECHRQQTPPAVQIRSLLGEHMVEAPGPVPSVFSSAGKVLARRGEPTCCEDASLSSHEPADDAAVHVRDRRQRMAVNSLGLARSLKAHEEGRDSEGCTESVPAVECSEKEGSR